MNCDPMTDEQAARLDKLHAEVQQGWNELAKTVGVKAANEIAKVEALWVANGDRACGYEETMTNPMIPDEAVEAAARALDPYTMGIETATNAAHREAVRQEVRLALEAAAPHLTQPRKPKPGEGDYLPGWDDRKTLAEMWQAHAPLPEQGLREGTYDALIAVAKWGYQQRKDEEL